MISGFLAALLLCRDIPEVARHHIFFSGGVSQITSKVDSLFGSKNVEVFPVSEEKEVFRTRPERLTIFDCQRVSPELHRLAGILQHQSSVCRSDLVFR